MLVRVGVDDVLDAIKPGEPLPRMPRSPSSSPCSSDPGRAVAAVAATLAWSMESEIESLVGRILTDCLDQLLRPEPGSVCTGNTRATHG